jgi:hypothetical protein
LLLALGGEFLVFAGLGAKWFPLVVAAEYAESKVKNPLAAVRLKRVHRRKWTQFEWVLYREFIMTWILRRSTLPGHVHQP